MSLERAILFVGVVALTLAMAVMSPAEPAKPQGIQGCAPRDRAVARLAVSYGNFLQSTRFDAQHQGIAVLASPTSGDWILTAARPDGLTCLLTSSYAFRAPVLRPPPRGKGA